MKLPFELVLNYAYENKPSLVQKATEEFFSETGTLSKKEEEQASSLFSEWLIYDFVDKSGISIIKEYVLKNPDKLGADKIDKFTQVIQIQKYGVFEVLKTSEGEWAELKNFFTDEEVLVYDENCVDVLPIGLLHARVAKVDDKWFFVGTHPTFISFRTDGKFQKLGRGEPGSG